MGASMALAGMTGCTRQPDEPIVPYVKQPEELIPGIPKFFATTMPFPTGAIPLLVKSNEFRPTKIEGNPQHPASGGATDVFAQASILDLYDPDRSPPKDSRAASQEMGGFIGRLMEPQVLRAVQQLKPIADEAGLTLPQFALAWVLREPNVASAIIGASRPQQVRENAAASGVIVDTQLFLRAEAILDEALGRVETA